MTFGSRKREAQNAELQRPKKGFRPKANANSRPKKDKDGRKSGHRQHPSVVRPPIEPGPDGGVNRTKPAAVANLRSIIRTCQKHGRNFLNYGMSLIDLEKQLRPLPFATASPLPAEPLATNTS